MVSWIIRLSSYYAASELESHGDGCGAGWGCGTGTGAGDGFKVAGYGAGSGTGNSVGGSGVGRGLASGMGEISRDALGQGDTHKFQWVRPSRHTVY